jgi:hypothetical protein
MSFFNSASLTQSDLADVRPDLQGKSGADGLVGGGGIASRLEERDHLVGLASVLVFELHKR